VHDGTCLVSVGTNCLCNLCRLACKPVQVQKDGRCCNTCSKGGGFILIWVDLPESVDKGGSIVLSICKLFAFFAKGLENMISLGNQQMMES
jgi:hypothetical protein